MSPRIKEDFEKMKEASREKILMTAFELFAEKGYSSSSVENIAQKAKISKGLIYHYFKSKEEILKGIFFILQEQLNQVMLENKELQPEEYIQKMIAFSFRFIVQQTQANRLLISLALQPKVIEGIKEDLAAASQTWMNQLIQMFTQLGYESPEAEAYLLGAVFDGISVGYQTFGNDYPINEIEKLIIKKYKR